MTPTSTRSPSAASPARPGLREAVAVWALWGLFAVAVGITYARLPPAETYAVTLDGAQGGASRAALLLAGPFAPVAAVLAAFAFARRPARATLVVALAAAAFALTVAWPGVMRRADLDFRVANVPALAGVALALLLTLAVVRTAGAGRLGPWRRGDGARLGASALLALASLPWLLAEAGVRPSVVPGLLDVHLGHHEGMEGVLLALSALWLARPLARVPAPLGAVLSLYLAILLAYGLAVAFADGWLEQVVRRGWTAWRPPDVLVPQANAGWAVVLAGALAVHLLVFRPRGGGAA